MPDSVAARSWAGGPAPRQAFEPHGWRPDRQDRGTPPASDGRRIASDCGHRTLRRRDGFSAGCPRSGILDCILTACCRDFLHEFESDAQTQIKRIETVRFTSRRGSNRLVQGNALGRRQRWQSGAPGSGDGNGDGHAGRE